MKLEKLFKLRIIDRHSRVLLVPITILLLVPPAAHAQRTPFDTGFQALQNLFTGTVAKVASIIAIVIGGYQLAHGEPGARAGQSARPHYRQFSR
jgi:type IV secretory pathway VirB2 component (pilin)